jgi:peptidoglycan hydrolase-like protein with peptidoglycan-binding domain
MARRPVLVASLAGAAAVGAAAAVSLTGAQATPAPPALPRLTTATLSRTTLTESALTEGTLGYRASAPVINSMAGTYTWLPEPGKIIRPGQALYRVDDQPVVLLRGDVPAWRSFEPGMTSGPDVRQLTAALIAGHFAAGLLTAPSDEFTWATAAAVQRWQSAHGLALTGQIPLGRIVFLPGALRVGGWQVAAGGAAQPGQAPYLVTADRRVVTVPVTPDMPVVHAGQSVSILLPAQPATAGIVTSIGPAPATASSSAAGGGSSTGNGGGNAAAQNATAFLFVTPVTPAATGTGDGVPVQVSLAIQVARDVLSAPVSALLALAGGGYGVQVVLPSGAHRLIGVHTGIFASGLVQVSGAGLTAGTKVVVSQ